MLQFKELAEQPLCLLEKCCLHLELENIYNSGAIPLNDWIFAGEPDPVRPSLLPALHELYDNRIRSLARYLNDDLSEWLE